MTVNELYLEYIKECRRLRRSPKTIDNYETVLPKFVSFAGSDLPASEIGMPLIKQYMSLLSERPISESTYSNYLRHIKSFLNWACEEYSLDINTRKIKIPRDKKKCPTILSDENIKLLFSSIRAESNWLTVRNRAMVALMLDSGLRQSEICGLLYKNIHFDKNHFKVLGKGSKERIVPLGSNSAAFLLQYLELCPHDCSGHVFMERWGEPVSPGALKCAVSKLRKKLPFPLTCHLLRHNFATNWCLDQYEAHGQIDVYSLMIIMGHENIKTTERYIHYAKSLIAARYSPSHLDKVFRMEPAGKGENYV